MIIDPQMMTYVLGTTTLLGIVFSIYLYFRNPQIQSDKDALHLRDDLDSLKKEVAEIKEKHLNSIEQDIKELSKTINQLSITVTRLSTIIDERIPKAV